MEKVFIPRIEDAAGEIYMENAAQKKVFGKRVIVTLGIISVVLLAGLVGTIVFYISVVGNLNLQIARMNSEISSLNSQLAEKDNVISSLNAQITTFQNTLTAKDSQIKSLNSTIFSLYDYLYLNVSAVLVYAPLSQDANSSTSIWNYMLQFAGYVTVHVQSSSNTTYVELSYSYYEVDYRNIVTVGTNGTAAFPVLPAFVEIRVGNTDINPVTATVMAIYYC